MGYRADWNRYAVLGGRGRGPCGAGYGPGPMRPSLGQFSGMPSPGMPGMPGMPGVPGTPTPGRPGAGGAPLGVTETPGRPWTGPAPTMDPSTWTPFGVLPAPGPGSAYTPSPFTSTPFGVLPAPGTGLHPFGELPAPGNGLPPMASAPGPLGPTFTSYAPEQFVAPEPIVEETTQFFQRGEVVPVVPQANFPPFVATTTSYSPRTRETDEPLVIEDYDRQGEGTIFDHPLTDMGNGEELVMMDGGFFPKRSFMPPEVPVQIPVYPSNGNGNGIPPIEEVPPAEEALPAEEILPLDLNLPAHVYLMTTMGKNESCFFEPSEYGLSPLSLPPPQCEEIWSKLMVDLGFEDEAMMADLQLFYLAHRDEFLAYYKAQLATQQATQQISPVSPPQLPATKQPLTPEPTNWVPWAVGGVLLLGAAYYFWPREETKAEPGA